MKILVIDDEWEDRKETYLQLSAIRNANLSFDFIEAPAQIPDKVLSERYDMYFVDVVLDRKWGNVSLREVLRHLDDRVPVVLVSSAWDETNFEDLRKEWYRANIRLAFKWREIDEEDSRPVIVLQLKKALSEWRKQEELHLGVDDPVRILHLSDLQFGGFDDSRFPAESQAMGHMVRQAWDRHGPTLIAITGDIAEQGLPNEYGDAETWLKMFVGGFDGWSLPSSRILLVEGNHDVCVPLAASGRVGLGGDPKELQLMADKRSDFDILSLFAFEPFRQFAWRVTCDYSRVVDRSGYWLNGRYLSSAGLVLFGVNTSESISRDGFAHPMLLPKSVVELGEGIKRDIGEEGLKDSVVIGLLHHSPFEEYNSRGIANPAEFEILCRNIGTPVLVLHGHVHYQESKLIDVDDDFQVLKISASTPTKDGSSRPSDTLRGFNLLELQRQNGKVTGMLYHSYSWHKRRLEKSAPKKFARRFEGKWERIRVDMT